MRILLADAQPKVRFALRVLLERQSDLEVVGEVADARQLLDKAGDTCPDIVLLAWELPGLTTELLPALNQTRPALAVVALSGRPEARTAALAAGVDAFVSKSDPPERLLAAIHDCGCTPSHGTHDHEHSNLPETG